MPDNIEVIEPKLFTAVVADEIVASIRDAIEDKGSCSLVLSGGSTPGAIYRLLSKPPRIAEVEWEKLDLYWGDERYVAQDHSNSNFRMTNETLMSHLSAEKPRVHAVDTSYDSAEKAAAAYESLIRKVEKLEQNALPVFDIVLLGIGEDGHTASLFPHSKILALDRTKICGAADHPEGGKRISLTQHALFNAKKILFIVKGSSKAAIIKRVIRGSDSPEELPSRYYLAAKERVTFFLDSEAATGLQT